MIVWEKWFESIGIWIVRFYYQLTKPLFFFFSSRASLPPASRARMATRWKWSWRRPASGWWSCGTTSRRWIRPSSTRWRTWPSWPVSMRPLCCTTSRTDTTPDWSMWVQEYLFDVVLVQNYYCGYQRLECTPWGCVDVGSRTRAASDTMEPFSNNKWSVLLVRIWSLELWMGSGGRWWTLG